MNPNDFEIFRDLLKKESGLHLSAEKTYLLESRLGAVTRKWDLDDLSALAKKLSLTPPPEIVRDVVEAMTTNETSFFRDGKPFKLFEEIVWPYLKKSRPAGKPVKIWCAACSSGQEPYSLAMTIKENNFDADGRRFEITATDISHEILEKAQSGLYSQLEAQRGLPVQYLVKYFEKKDQRWQIKSELQDMIRFQYLNLLQSLSNLGVFDIIFCRNVLIYFDEETKADILNRIDKQLAPDGFLFLGGAETVIGITDKFTPMPGQRGIYIKANNASAEKFLATENLPPTSLSTGHAPFKTN